MLNFKEDGIEIYDSLLGKETIKLLKNQTFNAQIKDCNIPKESNNPIVEGVGVHEIYSDLVMETILSTIHPLIEKKLNLSLVPTYAYYRTYYPGNNLLRHIDRPSCEISATILLDAQYKNNSNYRWEIFADTIPYKNKEILNPDDIPISEGIGVKQKPGDALIYRGCDVPHWRDEFVADEGSYHTQLFCHFIDKNGPHYPKYKYDSRPGLGFPKNKS